MDHARTAVRPLIADRREPGAIGRSARLELAFEVVGGRTRIAHAYAEPPLRVGRALSWGDGLHVILASSAPGLFEGDRIDQRVTLAAGARVLFTSQSALQVHPSIGAGLARVRGTFEVGAGALLCCQWDPVIPFAGSRIDQRFAIELGEGSRLCWGDGMMAGRVGRGECWRFRLFAHELRIARNGRLEYLERHRIAPEEQEMSARWTAGEACYFGSTAASGWPAAEGLVEPLHQTWGADAPGAAVAIERLDAQFLLARFACASGPVFHEARRAVFEACVRSAV
ncbi:MAG: urease accessory protein UreD [Vicinamibacterales bacterium]